MVYDKKNEYRITFSKKKKTDIILINKIMNKTVAFS